MTSYFITIYASSDYERNQMTFMWLVPYLFIPFDLFVDLDLILFFVFSDSFTIGSLL